jgi:hypothetical protein
LSLTLDEITDNISARRGSGGTINYLLVSLHHVDVCSVAGLLEVYIAFKMGLLNQRSYVYGIVIIYCTILLHFSISVPSFFFTISHATECSITFIKSHASQVTTTSNHAMGREQNGDAAVLDVQWRDGAARKWRWKSVKNLAGKICHFTDSRKQDG